jgi:hypothetical protein
MLLLLKGRSFFVLRKVERAPKLIYPQLLCIEEDNACLIRLNALVRRKNFS